MCREKNLYFVKVAKAVDGMEVVSLEVSYDGKENISTSKNILGFKCTDGKLNPDNPINCERKSRDPTLREYNCIQIKMINPAQKKR